MYVIHMIYIAAVSLFQYCFFSLNHRWTFCFQAAFLAGRLIVMEFKLHDLFRMLLKVIEPPYITMAYGIGERTWIYINVSREHLDGVCKGVPSALTFDTISKGAPHRCKSCNLEAENPGQHSRV